MENSVDTVTDLASVIGAFFVMFLSLGLAVLVLLGEHGLSRLGSKTWRQPVVRVKAISDSTTNIMQSYTEDETGEVIESSESLKSDQTLQTTHM